MKIENFALIEIGRQKGASALQNVGMDDAQVKELLIEALPLGNPENEFFKISRIGKDLFISSLILEDSKDYGLALIVKFDSELQKHNPILLIDNMNQILTKCLKNDIKTLENSLNIEYNEITQETEAFENFDNFIFSILTEQKTLVVGEKAELKKFLSSFYEFMPNDMKRHLTLIANSSTLNDRVGLQALILTDEVLKVIDAKKGDYTTLFLPMKTAYGSYTSAFCKNIAKLYSENKKASVKEELMHFLKMAIQTQELPPVGDFAAENDLQISDASLVLWMRANHFELELEKGFFEQLQ